MDKCSWCRFWTRMTFSCGLFTLNNMFPITLSGNRLPKALWTFCHPHPFPLPPLLVLPLALEVGLVPLRHFLELEPLEPCTMKPHWVMIVMMRMEVIPMRILFIITHQFHPYDLHTLLVRWSLQQFPGIITLMSMDRNNRFNLQLSNPISLRLLSSLVPSMEVLEVIPHPLQSFFKLH